MPDEKFRDDEIVPDNALGGGGKFKVANPNIKLDLEHILSEPPANPFLYIRRIDNGFIPSNPELESAQAINPVTSEVIDLKGLKESESKSSGLTKR